MVPGEAATWLTMGAASAARARSMESTRPERSWWLNSTTPEATRATEATSTTSASRIRIGTGDRLAVSESVAHASHRFDMGPFAGTVGLAPKVGDVLIDHVRRRIVGEVPDVLQDVGPGEDLSRMAHEQLKQRKFLWGEHDLFLPPPHPPAGRFETKLPHDQGGGSILMTAPNERSDAGTELREAEGLHQIVVSSRVQASHAVVDPVSCGHHDHRGGAACGSQVLAE